MKKGIYLLPNLITLLSMFSGFYSIVASLNSDYERAAWAIMVAAVFDVLDGWVARLTHTSTKFGIEIDSLSDAISFGVAPGVLVYTWALSAFRQVGWLGSFFLVACAALRLARFNVQMGSTEKKNFTGLPSPAAAMGIALTVLAYEDVVGFLENIGWAQVVQFLSNDYWVLALTFLLAGLMVSNIPYHSLKEVNLKERRPFEVLIAIIIFMALVAYNPAVFLFCVTMLYVASGILEGLYHLLRKRKTAAG